MALKTSIIKINIKSWREEERNKKGKTRKRRRKEKGKTRKRREKEEGRKEKKEENEEEMKNGGKGWRHAIPSSSLIRNKDLSFVVSTIAS